MLFKRMSLQGFKSFADPVTIEFDKGITCIVGPNGSGKSNLSDALRWVLGEQSARMLRGGKMDDVIFSGTANRKSRGMAEVTLVIDNGQHELPIDFEEVSITRRMFRSGESEYLINGAHCRLRDIRELIMDTGIGVEGYSLIGQGKIAEIVSGKPENRREIFEEAAGIVRYRSRKAEAERKLDAAQTDLDRVNDIIEELGQRIDPLKTASEKAEQYIRLRKEYETNEVNVILLDLNRIDQTAEELKQKARETEDRIQESERTAAEWEQVLQSARQRTRTLETEERELFEKQVASGAGLEASEGEIRIAREKIAAREKESGQLRGEIRAQQEKTEEKARELRETEGLLETMAAAIQAAQKKYDTLCTDLSVSEQREEEEVKKSEEDRNRIYDLSIQSSSFLSEIQSLGNLQKSLEERRQKILQEADLSSMQDSGDDLQKAGQELEAEGEKKTAVQRELQVQKENLRTSESTMEHLHREMEDRKLRLHREQTRRDMLQSLEHSYEGYQYAVRFLMKDSNSDGIYGTVGDLITVPKEYEQAIGTALGARIQNIVCRDDRSADLAIRRLKQSRAGRLTFLPVNSLRVYARRRSDAVEQEPGYLGVAADCVQCEETCRKAVEYLLGNILVMKTLPDALSASRKSSHFRYVTLDGEFVNPAGAITGGAYQKKNDDSILSRKNRILECEQNIRMLKEELDQKRQAWETAKADRDALAQAAEENEEKLRILEQSLIRRTEEYESSKKLFEMRHESVSRVLREKERIEEESRNTAARIRQLEEEKKILDEELQQRKEAAEASLGRQEARGGHLKALRNAQMDARLELENLMVEQEGRKDLCKRIQAEIGDLEDSLHEKERRIGQTETECRDLQEEIRQLSSRMEDRRQENQEQSRRMEELRQEKAALGQEIEEQENRKATAQENLFQLKSALQGMHLQLEQSAQKSESLKNRLWDDFEITFPEARRMEIPAFRLSRGQKESRRLRSAIRALGEVSLSSIEEYREVSDRYQFLTAQRDDLVQAAETLRKIIRDADRQIRKDFQSGFEEISAHFQEIFRELFHGGQAELVIDKPEDPLTAGIDIIVQPPGKKLQNMNLLSGGEKTMTAIALMFAVLKTKPTPLCILDEVEAALDEANIERFAEYLRTFGDIQFVLVTHQKVTMEHANVLYGVTMPEKGISRVLSLKLEEAHRMEGLE